MTLETRLTRLEQITGGDQDDIALVTRYLAAQQGRSVAEVEAESRAGPAQRPGETMQAAAGRLAAEIGVTDAELVAEAERLVVEAREWAIGARC